MAKSYGQFCALARALDHVGDRWTLLVVRELLIGPCRYSDLRTALPGVATNLLAERLRQLEADGLVARRELPPPAASTVYELTPLGAALDEAVQALIRWGGIWMVAGRGGDAFEPRWLALALRALAGPAPADTRGAVDVLVDGAGADAAHADTARIRLSARDGTLAVALVDPADDAGAVATVRGNAEAVLFVAAGQRPFGAAVRAGLLRVAGDRAAARALFDAFGPTQAPHRPPRRKGAP